MSELVGSHLLCVCLLSALVLWKGGREQHGGCTGAGLASSRDPHRALFKLEDSLLPPPWPSLPSPHLSLGSIHTHSKSLTRRTVCFQRKNTLTY